MFTLLSALVFSGAFLLAVGTIGWMLALYHDKMMAALLLKPMPRDMPACSLHITRRRVTRREDRATTALTGGVLAA